MINIANRPTNSYPFIEDFVTERYRKLLRIAKQHYASVGYDEIPYGTRFILWRHDCDYSLNRSFRLATIEHEENVKATYFINPHCEFYNPFERSQSKLIEQILGMGHMLGLHFDAASYEADSEEKLHDKVSLESAMLKQFFGVQPKAFSFHNPTEFLLAYESEIYGGLINCYSKRFKTEVPYYSDSNGYWRFHRLQDVLVRAEAPCLQVLTHPGWWQERPMYPRQRIFRCIYDRAAATMRSYDSFLEACGRINISGESEALRFMKPLNPNMSDFCDYLWNQGKILSLFIELWRLHESQINTLCNNGLITEWKAPAREVSAFFEDPNLTIDGWRLFSKVFDVSWEEVTKTDLNDYQQWLAIRNQLIQGRGSIHTQKLEEGCLYLCRVFDAVTSWGKACPGILYDGMAQLGRIGSLTNEGTEDKESDDILNFKENRWREFKKSVLSHVSK